MNGLLWRWLERCYTALLRLYPRVYRETFAAEMLDTFRDALADVRGGQPHALRGVAGLCLRELWDWPACLWRAFRWEGGRPREVTVQTTAIHEEPHENGEGRWSEAETRAAIALFAVCGLIYIAGTYLVPLLGRVPAIWFLMGTLDAGALFALPIGGLIAGWARGLPRWVYVYACLPLSIAILAAMYLSGQTAAALVPPIVVCALCAAVPSLRGLARRAWRDPTLLSLAVYGVLPLALVIAFDDAHPNNTTPFLALAWVLPVAGVWLYARAGWTWQKFLVLWLAAMLSLLMPLLDIGVTQTGDAFGVGRLILDGWYSLGSWVLAWMRNLTVLLLAPALLWAARRAWQMRAAV